MKIEIWTDFTCPDCYIAKKSFELALEKFEKNDCITIEFKSFQLEADAKVADGRSYLRKSAPPLVQLTDVIEQLQMKAEQVGIELNLDNLYQTCTYDAHRLVKYANQLGKGTLLMNLIYESYFKDNLNIGEITVLQSFAEELEFDQEEVLEILTFNKFASSVREDIELAAELGIDRVPFFIINEQHAISGAQPTEIFLEILNEIWELEGQFAEKTQASETTFCVGKHCDSK